LERVLAALDACLATPVETRLNAVLLRGVNDDEAADLAALSIDRPLGVRFIELMPFDGNAFRRADLVSMVETRAAVEARFGPLTPVPTAPDSTSQTFRIAGARGTVGFVASMTAPFCAGCTRLRLTADGSLKVCLFGAAETSLRDAFRSGATDADLEGLIAGAVGRKHARHAGLDALPHQPNRPMIAIGG
jgi:cyclic pyranopterin phosphate synthase